MLNEKKIAVVENNGPNATQGSLIDAGTKFKGTIKFNGRLRIEGQLDGKIISDGDLFIGKTGDIKANIEVGTIVVEGHINGNIQAKNKVTLQSTAKVGGDITANKLIINEGAIFVGRSESGKPDLGI